MKGFLRYVGLIAGVISVITAQAQVNFKTVVPQRPVVVGESIQVQYVVENGEEIMNFSPPPFAGFRYVTGPNVYSGKIVDKENRSIRYKNMVITLMAAKTGKFIIQGASCTINGKSYTSNDVPVVIISQKQAEELRRRNEVGKDDAAFFLAPGEDPMQKIRKNLFFKIGVG